MSTGSQEHLRRAQQSSGAGAHTSVHPLYQEWVGYEAHDVPEEHEEPLVDPQLLANALGWFSIGLGLVQLLAPRAFGRAIGVGEHPVLVRAIGAREVVNGIGLLSQRSTGTWAWSRVAGDALDLSLLAIAARRPAADRDLQRLALATSAALGVTSVDVYTAQALARVPVSEPAEMVSASCAVNSSPQALYAFWKDLANLPRFMSHLESVTRIDERTSHWVAKGPAGMSVEWDAEIVRDDPDEGFSWQTVPGSEVTHEGTVRFDRDLAGRGTIVRVQMRYIPPAGRVGRQLGRLLGEDPQAQIEGDLRRLKQLIETGEVATTIGQPAGRRSVLGRVTLGRRLQ